MFFFSPIPAGSDTELQTLSPSHPMVPIALPSPTLSFPPQLPLRYLLPALVSHPMGPIALPSPTLSFPFQVNTLFPSLGTYLPLQLHGI